MTNKKCRLWTERGLGAHLDTVRHLFCTLSKWGHCVRVCQCVCIDSKPSTPFFFFSLHHPSANTESPPLTEEKPTQLVEIFSSHSCNFVHLLYDRHTLSHTVLHAYTPVFPFLEGCAYACSI